MSYTIDIEPAQVDAVLKKYILKDGMDLVLDLERSQGAYAYDSKHERRLLDFFTCFATVPLGYNHPAMTNDRAFQNSLLHAALVNPSNSDIYTTEYAHFLETFSRVAKPSYMKYSFFISGGALAVENALKVAMDWKVQKNFKKGYTREVGTRVLHFEHAFHGRTGYTMSLTNTDPAKTRYFAKFDDWPRVSFPNICFPYTDESHEDLLQREELSIRQVKQAFKEYPDEICAIIVEPIQCEGGDNHMRKEFAVRLRELCDAEDCLLVYDEVQVGVGATGKFWAHEHFGEKALPDVIAFGKKMQVCGIMAGPRLDEVPDNCFQVPSRINSTWGGSLVDMVRADKILEVIESDGLLAEVTKHGEYFLQQLVAVSQQHPQVDNVRGKGLIIAFDLPNTTYRNAFIEKGLSKDALFLGCATRTIRFRPTLTMATQEIDRGMQIIHEVLQELGPVA